MATATIPLTAASDGDADKFDAVSSWATLRSAGSATNVNKAVTNNWAVYNDGAVTGDPTKYIYRFLGCADLSSISAAATATAVVFRFYPTTEFHSAGGGFTVVGSSQASATDLVVADYGTVGSTEYIASRQTYAGLALNADNDLTFNAAGIAAVQAALGGTFRIALRGGHDLDNTAPSLNTNSGFLMNHADAASHKPSLIITYTLPGAVPAATPRNKLGLYTR